MFLGCLITKKTGKAVLTMISTDSALFWFKTHLTSIFLKTLMRLNHPQVSHSVDFANGIGGGLKL